MQIKTVWKNKCKQIINLHSKLNIALQDKNHLLFLHHYKICLPPIFWYKEPKEESLGFSDSTELILANHIPEAQAAKHTNV